MENERDIINVYVNLNHENQKSKTMLLQNTFFIIIFLVCCKEEHFVPLAFLMAQENCDMRSLN